MRRVLFFMLTTLNGYYEAGRWELGWHNVDEEFNDFAVAQLDSVDLLLFGRVTYEGMASYWPTPPATADDPVIAGKMNALPKVVFSQSLEQPAWANARLVAGDAAEEVAALRQQSGKDMLLLGSSDLAVTLAEAGLIDEYRIMVNPVALGDGKPLLKGLHGTLRLKLLRARTFNSGNVLLFYEPER